MKGFILALVVVVVIGVPTMLGFIPVFLGVPAMIAVVLIKDIIFLVLARGLPMAIIALRSGGGLLWGVMEKTGNIVVSKLRSRAGMVFTKGHGAYNVVTEGMVRIDNVPLFLAPEEVGYNVKPEHLQLLAELKRRGIKNIMEIIDVNEQGQFLNFKDDKRIRDLQEPLKISFKKGAINDILKFTSVDLPGLNDYHRYAIESAHPFRQDANVKIGIAQGSSGQKGSSAWMWVAVACIIAVVVLAALTIMRGGGGEVRVIYENARTVIPA